LLIGAGLLLQSFLRLLAVEPGYEPDEVLTATLELEPSRYPEPGQAEAFFDRLLTRLAGQGVEAAGVVSFPPLAPGFSLRSMRILGRPTDRTLSVVQTTSPGYLPALRMRLVKGRWLSEDDHATEAQVAVVNETFVRQHLGGQGALGQRLEVGAATLKIVGVVGDVRLLGLNREPKPELFTSYRQAEAVTGSGPTRLTVLVRTGDDPRALVPWLRSVVLDLDPTLPLEDVQTLQARLSASVARPRFYALLLGVFALLALLLAAAGVYGILAYEVSQRSREFGVRRALGARRRDLLGLMLREGLVLVAVGVGIGCLVAAGATRALDSLLFDVAHLDPLTYLLAPLVLLLVAVWACYLPARRATRVEPLVALRWE